MDSPSVEVFESSFAVGMDRFWGCALPVIDVCGDEVETSLVVDGGSGGVKLRFGGEQDLPYGPARVFSLAGGELAGRGTVG